MRKLLLIATLGVAGLMSANATNPTSDSCVKDEAQKNQKIEIKSSSSEAGILFAAKTRCYAYDSHGNLVEVPCPPIIVIED